VQFNISFDVADSPDLGSLASAEQQAILDVANVAATIWSWYLTPANIMLDLALTVDNTAFSGTVLAEGGPASFYSTGATFGGARVFESNTALELRTGQDRNGAAADLHFDLTVNSIRNLLVFKTDDSTAVSGNRVDALSVFLHEIAHGLGFLSFEGDTSSASIYDTFVRNSTFTGANAEAAANAPTGVPLQPGSISHISESGAFGADLMSPVLSRGTNEHISALDLGVLKDIGVPVRQATAGADIMHALYGAPLALGAGDDAGYAVGGGSTVYGEDGNDQLYGGKSRDMLYGGAGEDYLEGSGGNDSLDGGSGNDTAHYSGLASSYQITRLSSNSFQVQDFRSGAPDGTDVLTDIERLQWSDGSFSDSTPTPNIDPVLTPPAPSDFGDRGMPEILWQNDSGQAAIWVINGTTLAAGALVGSNPGPSWHAKGAGDFNGDGRSDILWQNDSGPAAIWTLNGTTLTGGGAVGGNPGPTWHVIGAGDFNGDGRSDILWQNDSGQAAIWTMNGTTMTGGAVVSGDPGPTWHVKGTGDFNGDGRSDILWQSDSGRAAIWTMNGTTMTGGAVVGGDPGPTWHVKGAGDFNGDGMSDILWQNDSGQAAIWTMNGTTIMGGAVVAVDPGPTWHVKGTSDFNGDGRSDILWQNDSGQAASWLMSGTSMLSGASLGPNPGTTWYIIAGS
jgi:hypothetical protein